MPCRSAPSTSTRCLHVFRVRHAMPSQAKPSQAKPSQATPSQARPGQAKIDLLLPPDAGTVGWRRTWGASRYYQGQQEAQSGGGPTSSHSTLHATFSYYSILTASRLTPVAALATIAKHRRSCRACVECTVVHARRIEPAMRACRAHGRRRIGSKRRRRGNVRPRRPRHTELRGALTPRGDLHHPDATADHGRLRMRRL